MLKTKSLIKKFLSKKKNLRLLKNHTKNFTSENSNQKESKFFLFKDFNFIAKEKNQKKNIFPISENSLKSQKIEEKLFLEIKKYFIIDKNSTEYYIYNLKKNYEELIFIIKDTFDRLQKENFLKMLIKFRMITNSDLYQNERESSFFKKIFLKKIKNLFLKNLKEKNMRSDILELVNYINFESYDFLLLFDTDEFYTNMEQKINYMNYENSKDEYYNMILSKGVDYVEFGDESIGGGDLFEITKDEELSDFFLRKRDFPEEIEKRVKKAEMDKIRNLEVFIYQEKNEIVLLKKEKDIKKSNWIYVMDLPFNFEYEEMYKIIEENFSFYGKIKKIFLVKYANFLQKSDEFEYLFKKELDYNDFCNFKMIMDNTKKYINKPKLDSDINENALNVPKSYKTNEKAIKTLGKDRYQRENFEKSYAFIEFDQYSQKENILTESNRVFGLYFDNRSHKLDNADYKTILKIHNIPYGTKLEQIMSKINKSLLENGITKFYIEKNMRNLILTSDSFLLEFENFEESLKSLVILNNTPFKGRNLKVNHVSLNLYYKNGKLIENVENFNKDRLDVKIKELRQREMVRNQKRFLKYDHRDMLFNLEEEDMSDVSDFDDEVFFDEE